MENLALFRAERLVLAVRAEVLCEGKQAQLPLLEAKVAVGELSP